MFVCKNCGCEFKKFESSEKKCPVCEIPFYNRVYYCINVSVDANELKVKMIRLKAEKEMFDSTLKNSMSRILGGKKNGNKL